MAEENGSVPAGNPSFDWSATLGQNYEAHKPLIETKKWSDPGAVLTSYSELEKMVGRDKFAVPGKDASPEEYRKIYSALGMPADPKGYNFEAPSDFEHYDRNFVDNWFRGAAHKAGLTPSQAKALHDEYVSHSRQAVTALAENSGKEDKDLDQALRTKWGGDYDKNISIAQAAVKQFGFSAVDLDKLEKITGSPALLEMFATIGEKMGTASIVNGSVSNNSPQGAMSEIEKLKGDKEFSEAYLNREHPGHAEALRRMAALNARAFPDAG